VFETALVTGASTGLGLALASSLTSAGAKVLGCGRTDLRARPPGFAYVQADVTTQVGLRRLAEHARAVLTTVELLVLNAGVYGQGGTAFDPAVPSQDLGMLRAAEALEVHAVNAVAPLMVVQELRALFRHGQPASLVVLVSSRVGSLMERTTTGDMYYAASKAAANMTIRCLAAIDPPIGTFVALDPGWFCSGAGGSSAPSTPAEVSARIVTLLPTLTADDSGAFLGLTGRVIPW
jgi:NAD(P)-dependent dehydrogenase (short-subunit alcohol dehydrogenase family)